PPKQAARMDTMRRRRSTGAKGTLWLTATAEHWCCRLARPTCRIETVRFRAGVSARFPVYRVADSGYAGEKVANATRIVVEIVRSSGQGFRGYHRLRNRLPLRRLRHAVDSQAGSFRMRFESDSKAFVPFFTTKLADNGMGLCLSQVYG